MVDYLASTYSLVGVINSGVLLHIGKTSEITTAIYFKTHRKRFLKAFTIKRVKIFREIIHLTFKIFREIICLNNT